MAILRYESIKAALEWPGLMSSMLLVILAENAIPFLTRKPLRVFFSNPQFLVIQRYKETFYEASKICFKRTTFWKSAQ